jgi:hypothetical protein
MGRQRIGGGEVLIVLDYPALARARRMWAKLLEPTVYRTISRGKAEA